MRNYRKFYEKNRVNYDEFLHRMMGKETLVEKYIQFFIADPTYSELEQAMAAHDFDTVGFKAHTLKGIALNLNFEKLGTLCMNLLNSVRSGDTSNLTLQFQQVKAEYQSIIEELGN